MLTRPRIIFFQFKLFRLGARVFFCHIKITCVGCAYEFNLKGRWLCHDTYSLGPNDISLPYNWWSHKIFAKRAVKCAKCQACISDLLICFLVALSPFCENLKMRIDGAMSPAFAASFCQFCHHRPNPVKCRRKQRSLQ